jgi:anti-sigma B factor antagonist
MTVTDSREPGASGAPDPDQFRVVIGEGTGGTLVAPHGELDIVSAPELEAVLAAQTGAVIVDLRNLRFIDASGLRILLQAQARSRQDGDNLRFIAGRAVRRLFEAAALADPLSYVDPPRA